MRIDDRWSSMPWCARRPRTSGRWRSRTKRPSRSTSRPRGIRAREHPCGGGRGQQPDRERPQSQPAGGAVKIRVTPTPSIEVLDSGPGVPANMREKIFERFWRGETSGRAPASDWPIVRRNHAGPEGDVSVTDAPGGEQISLDFRCSARMLTPPRESRTGFADQRRSSVALIIAGGSATAAPCAGRTGLHCRLEPCGRLLVSFPSASSTIALAICSDRKIANGLYISFDQGVTPMMQRARRIGLVVHDTRHRWFRESGPGSGRALRGSSIKAVRSTWWTRPPPCARQHPEGQGRVRGLRFGLERRRGLHQHPRQADVRQDRARPAGPRREGDGAAHAGSGQAESRCPGDDRQV